MPFVQTDNKTCLNLIHSENIMGATLGHKIYSNSNIPKSCPDLAIANDRTKAFHDTEYLDLVSLKIDTTTIYLKLVFFHREKSS